MNKSSQDETIDDWLPSSLLMHVARIRDVELLTGLSFLTKWSHLESITTNVHAESIGVKLKIQEFSGRWLSDFLNRDISYQLQKSEKTVKDCRNQLDWFFWNFEKSFLSVPIKPTRIDLQSLKVRKKNKGKHDILLTRLILIHHFEISDCLFILFNMIDPKKDNCLLPIKPLKMER